MPRGHAAADIVGQRFGRLVVTGRAPNGAAGARWHCVCDCGGVSQVQGTVLRGGRTVSCGCLTREVLRKPDDQITYNSAHYRVKRARGYPSEHPCAHCVGRAAHWALRREASVTHEGADHKGTVMRYSGDPADYFPLCATCHRRYDRP
jgi:hypothetical protein